MVHIRGCIKAAFIYRNKAVKVCKRLGRTVWKRWSGYHRRSLVETKMNCFKRLGEKVMARTFERQVVELNIRASILTHWARPRWRLLHNCIWGWDASAYGLFMQ